MSYITQAGVEEIHNRSRACKACGDIFIQYNTIQNLCRDCSIAKQRFLVATAERQKPIKQQGKQAAQWKLFREKVAIPYLDNNYGHVCSIPECTGTTNLDVDHIFSRGAHPELRYVVTNLRYLCRPHHIERTGVPRWTKTAV